jgi:hypothetical protein
VATRWLVVAECGDAIRAGPSGSAGAPRGLTKDRLAHGVDGVDGIAPDVGADFSERLTDQRQPHNSWIRPERGLSSKEQRLADPLDEVMQIPDGRLLQL